MPTISPLAHEDGRRESRMASSVGTASSAVRTADFVGSHSRCAISSGCAGFPSTLAMTTVSFRVTTSDAAQTPSCNTEMRGEVPENGRFDTQVTPAQAVPMTPPTRSGKSGSDAFARFDGYPGRAVGGFGENQREAFAKSRYPRDSEAETHVPFRVSPRSPSSSLAASELSDEIVIASPC